MPHNLIGQTLTCHETGKTFVAAIDGCTTNYAINDAGEIFSDEGVDLAQKRDLLDRTKPFLCYVSSDGKAVTGWKGNILGKVVQKIPCRLTRKSHWHGKDYSSVRVQDCHGGLWYGRGSAGLAITLRPMKGTK